MEEITGEDKTELPIRDPIFAFSNPISQGFEDQTELFLFPFKGLRFARNPKSGNLQVLIIPHFFCITSKHILSENWALEVTTEAIEKIWIVKRITSCYILPPIPRVKNQSEAFLS